MTDNNKGALGVLVMLLLAGAFALANQMMALIPGLALFEIADIPFAFLLDKHGDFWEKAGIFYGTAWPFLMFGIYVAGANRQVPEKWKDAPRLYKIGYVLLLGVTASILLALPLHLYLSWGR